MKNLLEMASRWPARFAGLAYALFAYVSFLASFGIYWTAFLADRWVPVTVDRRTGGGFPTWVALIVDLGLVLLFGLQHSIMARPAFKQRWQRIVPPALERATYVLLSSAFLALLMGLWQPWPALAWRVPWEPLRMALWVTFGSGLLVSVMASFQIDHFELFGLRQAWSGFRGRPWREPAFVQPWLYRVVRHPIQAGVLLMLWSAPTMTAGRLLLAASMTLYILVGLHFEERNLVMAIGDRYRDYRERVPGLIPFPAPRPGHGRRIAAATLVLILTGMAVAAARATPPEQPDQGLVHRSLSIQGMERAYAVYRPATLPREADTVVVLHGSGGTIERIRRFTGRRFESLADEHGFKLIYAQGFKGGWNGCRAGSPLPANRQDVDDVAFLRALLDKESAGRRFVFGFSGGGHMAMRLALEAPQVVDGVATVAANLPEADASDCQPSNEGAMPAVMLVNGTEDPINPYGGGRVKLPEVLGGAVLGAVRSSEATAQYFAARNGDGGTPAKSHGPERDGDPATTVRTEDWRATGHAPVRLDTIVGGGHTIPQAGVPFPALVGPQTADLDTPEAVWRFFDGAGVRLRTEGPAAARTRPTPPGRNDAPAPGRCRSARHGSSSACR